MYILDDDDDDLNVKLDRVDLDALTRFQKHVKRTIPARKVDRCTKGLVDTSYRYLANMSYETTILLAKEGICMLQELVPSNGQEGTQSNVVKNVLDWYLPRYCELYCVRAEANLALGRLFAAKADVEKVLLIHGSKKKKVCCLEDSWKELNESYCRGLQLRAYIYLLLGADEIAEHDLVELNDTLSRNPPKCMYLRELPHMQVSFTAADWHRTRRHATLEKYPKVRDLHENRSGSGGFLDPGTGMQLAYLLLALTVLHLAMMKLVATAQSYLLVFFLSGTLGSVTAYGAQALNHDLSHVNRHKGFNYVCMVLSSALCNFPWAMYYQHFHTIHHAYTGTELDRDGDILFQPWYSPPCFLLSLKWPRVWDSRITLTRWSELYQPPPEAEKMHKLDLAGSKYTRFLWGTLVGFFLYPLFLARKLQLDQAHIPTVEYEGLMLAGQIFCWRLGGFWALLYLWLSAAFSLGAFCHPFMGFWLIQHQSVRRTPKLSARGAALCKSLLHRDAHLPVPQPTLSYSGSKIWNVLNYGELYHVEHHDHPGVCAKDYPKIKSIAHEFYDSLFTETSIMSAIFTWVCAEDDEGWMQESGDFAFRDVYLDAAWCRSQTRPDDSKDCATLQVGTILSRISKCEPSRASS